MVNSAKSFRLLAWDMLSPHTDPKDFKDGYASLRGGGFKHLFPTIFIYFRQ